MAKNEAEPKIVMEREYNVPLRKGFMKAPRWKRTQKASKTLRNFLIKHMKSTDVKIGKYLNEELWKHGIRNPPHHLKVIATKDDKGVVRAELAGAPAEKEEKTKEKKAKKSKEAKVKAGKETKEVAKENEKKEADEKE